MTRKEAMAAKKARNLLQMAAPVDFDAEEEPEEPLSPEERAKAIPDTVWSIYDRTDHIGKGSVGDVWSAQRKAEALPTWDSPREGIGEVAIKCIDKFMIKDEDFTHEIDIMKMVHHEVCLCVPINPFNPDSDADARYRIIHLAMILNPQH